MACTNSWAKWQGNFGTAAHEFRNAERVHNSLLAAAEKRLLLALARRTPGWINSDHLTALGLASMALAGMGYWLARQHGVALIGVSFCLALNWLGDSLDGTLARHRNLLRPRYGFYVDHIVDAFSALFLLGGLAGSGLIHPFIAVALLVSYLLLSIESYLATYTMGRFTISHLGFGPTELRIVLAIGNGFLLFHPYAHLFGRSYLLFDVGGVCAVVGMTCTFLFLTFRHTRTLYREEKIW